MRVDACLSVCEGETHVPLSSLPVSRRMPVRASVTLGVVLDGTVDRDCEQETANLGQRGASAQGERQSASQVDEFPHHASTTLSV